jgi:hypothetical protein
MRMVRPAFAFAAAFVVAGLTARAEALLPADRPIAEVVDHYVDALLLKEGIRSAGLADDPTLCRRLTLDLAGRIPTADEWRAFEGATEPDKWDRLVDRLMASSGFVRHQATELESLLLSGGKGSLRAYLIKAAGENRPWDRIFRELMVPDQTDKLGKVAADYLRQGASDLDRLTADVSSTFFGVNISCAQCHDHPLVRDWKQDHFFGMKSFLSRTFVNGSERAGYVAERSHGTIRFKTTEDVERQARLMFLTGSRVDEPDAKEPTKDEQKKEKAEFDRLKKANLPPAAPAFSARAQLVEIALRPADRDFFAKAIVNRIWYRLFGQGLVMPLDQMHSANPPSHPDLLAWLARDTANHGYDLRRLIRGLVLSKAYARTSRWEGTDPAPRPSLFALALVRPLTPMQLAVALKLATTDPAQLPAELAPEPFDRRIAAIEENARSLVTSLATKGGDAQIGVAEALYFSNGKRISSELSSDGADRLVGLLKRTSAPAEVVDLAFRNVLSRSPDLEEARTLGAYLGQRTDRPEDACQQLVWILMTGSEFRFNH